jgi:ComF family protein
MLGLLQGVAGRKSSFARAGEKLMKTVYPPSCLACHNLTETPMGLCASCWRETHFLAGPVCDICGTPQSAYDEQQVRIVCDDCTHNPHAWDAGRCAVAYDGAGRDVVLKLKHSDRPDIAKPLARWITGAAAPITEDVEVVVPVPLHRLRLLQRKYNQAAELARHVAGRLTVPYCADGLLRHKATAPQHGTRAERYARMQRAICANPGRVEQIKGRRVLLVDDVITTGATMAACAEQLRGMGAETVKVVALARVVRDT